MLSIVHVGLTVQQNWSHVSCFQAFNTLEYEIADYEHRTSRRPRAERHQQETFSGYTLAIVDSVTKLTCYFRDL